MADLPIPFTPVMMQANLALRKSQTRRPMVQPTIDAIGCRPVPTEGRSTRWEYFDASGRTEAVKLKYAIGDRLYAREAWRTFVSLDSVAPRDLLTDERGAGIAYIAGGGLSITKPPRAYHYDNDGRDEAELKAFGKFRQGMHLPRWGSRATCVVTAVKVERLNDISEEDAIAEGVTPHPSGLGFWVPGVEHPDPNFPWLSRSSAREMYAALWDVIHGSGAWGINPFVPVYSFNFIPKNIDDI